LIQDGNLEGARRQLDWYYDVFGNDRFFLELQSHDIPELERINKNLIDLGRRYQARFVATNDVHYINQDDARLQDIMLAIQTGCLISDPDRMRMTDNTYYLRSPEEMGRIFAEVPEALNNTLLIAERCNVDLGFKGYRLPNFEVPEGCTVQSYLCDLCEKGVQNRYGARASDPTVRERLDYELRVIHEMGFDTYFLIVWDLCRYARSQGIWYNARGSAAGSIVAYSLDITLVDPIDHGLIFERFLNPGRISMPDIDLDFRDDRRADMLEYTARKYGDDRVAQIITFGTLGARAAIRDVGRVMDVPLSEVDKVAKLIPNVPGKPTTIPQALEDVAEFKQVYDTTPYMRELIDTAAQVEGVVRNAGTHAAGVIIADKPIIDYVPLHRPTGSQAGESPIKTVTQFEMNVLDSLGLLKVDFLGLATLTTMARACDLIFERHGVRLTLDNIPTDDPATYDLLGRGDTAGVFQVEGSGMRRWLMEMKPKELANVIAMVALFRPGPMEFIPGFIRRMHGEESVEYRHPLLESIFKETYGYPVYQEQLIFAAMKLAGYPASEADDLRKAVAKKIKDKMVKHREKFIAGAVANGVPPGTAEAIFDDWEEFARYGFNKSHAVDYGVIAVQTAYLKVHYAVEYMTALLSVSKNDTAKVALYVADCRRMGISVEPPEINTSQWDFAIEDQPDGNPVIRFGLGAVKNVGQGPVDAILNARQGGEFTNLNDFARRVDLRLVGRRALECLVKVGALDCFGSRPSLLQALDQVVAVSTAHFRAAETGQLSLFGAHTGVIDEISLPKQAAEASRREVLSWERELLGLYVTDHPLTPVMQDLQEVVTHFSGQLSDVAPEEKVRVAGLITRVRHHTSKAGKPMAFVTLEDLQGIVELVIFPRVWEQTAGMVEVDRIVLVDGRVDNQGAEPKILVESLTSEFSRLVSAGGPTLPGGESNQSQRNEAYSGFGIKRSPSGFSTWKESEEVDVSLPGDLDWASLPPQPDFPTEWDAPNLQEKGNKPSRLDDRKADAAMKKNREYKETAENNSDIHIQVVEDSTLPEEEVSELSTPVYAAPIDNLSETQKVLAPPAPAVSPVLNQLPPETSLIPPVVSPIARKPAPESGSIERRLDLPPYLVSPTPLDGSTGEVRMLTVVLRATGDKTRDVLRIRRIHGIITSYPGNDRFAIHVYERGRGYLLEFPNFTVGVTTELADRLTALLGVENIRVETITFQ
jgi:DNA polymerase-3 subunit alpha